jgi:tetratricopeptide (TPR) repeat protein
VDALEFLVWDHMRLGHQSQSAQRARELIAISPGNPIAMAALNQNAPSAPRGKNTVQQRLAALKSAISGLDHLNKPEGMLDRNFQMLRQQVAIMLTGAMGMSYLEIEDYPEARLALQQAVASDPNNAPWVYGLALALLNGKNRDQYRGYWYLARASNLTGGTPQGQEIASYARRTYHQDGGKEEGWERFLASAAAAQFHLQQSGIYVCWKFVGWIFIVRWIFINDRSGHAARWRRQGRNQLKRSQAEWIERFFHPDKILCFLLGPDKDFLRL